MPNSTSWDHTSHPEFVDYYAHESLTPRTRARFAAMRDTILRKGGRAHRIRSFDIADIGCGAGTQSLIWAELGCRVHALDVNRPLLELARQRAAEAGYTIDFRIGSAAALPWPDESMDICLAIELLEHVTEWRTCLKEFARVIRRGGVVFLTTSNRLCPIQQEFNLPLYSWYPGPIKRYCERLALTTRPQLANYAKYPAVNWFSYYQLRRLLASWGFDCYDRFDLVDVRHKGTFATAVLAAIKAVPGLRRLAHVATPGTTVLAVKR
jgi:ubiquinone/menaquinone biosynthesis C-methylase UbiE